MTECIQMYKSLLRLTSPHIDKMFDQGLITFTDAGDQLCTEPRIE